MANNGDLTCSAHQEIERTLMETWGPDNAYNAQRSVVKGGTIEAFLAEQTATFGEIEDKTSANLQMKIYWLEDCPIGTKACDTTCTAPVSGVEFGDNCMTVDCDTCVQADTIKISDAKLKNSKIDFDEMVAAAIYRADQAIVEAINVNAITTLDSLSQPNLNTDTWNGNVVPAALAGECTLMTAAIWSDPWNYFFETSALNNYSDPYLIGGQAYSKFAYNQGTPIPSTFNGEGLQEVNGWRMWFDLRAFDANTTGTDPKLFMVNRGEFAYVNCYNYPEVGNWINLENGRYAYRIQSPILTGYAGRPIYHDVVYTRTCDENNNILSINHYWEISNHYSIEQSPADCDGHNRVLCFTCGTPAP